MKWSLPLLLWLPLLVQSPRARPDCEADVFVLQDLDV